SARPAADPPPSAAWRMLAPPPTEPPVAGARVVGSHGNGAYTPLLASSGGRSPMPIRALLTLVARFAAAYRGTIAVVAGLQLVATLAALLLPSINADIIDRGVVVGDTG